MKLLLIVTAAALALIASPAAIEAKTKTASESYVRGKIAAATKSLKKRDTTLVNRAMTTMRKSLRAYPLYVAGFRPEGMEDDDCAVIAEWLDGDVRLCIGPGYNVGNPDDPGNAYGPHYAFLYLDTVIPLQRGAPYDEGSWPRLGCDEVRNGSSHDGCWGDDDHSRFTIAFADLGEMSLGGLYGEDTFVGEGLVFRVMNAVLNCPARDDCWASAYVQMTER